MNLFSYFFKILSEKKIEKEAIKKVFETGNIVIARKKEDGSVEWQEIKVKK